MLKMSDRFDREEKEMDDVADELTGSEGASTDTYESSEHASCTYIYKRGKKEGERCTNKAKDGQETCWLHKRKAANQCCYVYQRGNKHGTQCPYNVSGGNRLCWKHKTRDFSQLLGIDPLTAARSLHRQIITVRRDLERIQEQAKECEDKMAEMDTEDEDAAHALQALQEIRDLELR